MQKCKAEDSDGLSQGGDEMLFTFIVCTEDKCPVAGHNLKLVVFGRANHLYGCQRNHTFWVRVLEERERDSRQQKKKNEQALKEEISA